MSTVLLCFFSLYNSAGLLKKDILSFLLLSSPELGTVWQVPAQGRKTYVIHSLYNLSSFIQQFGWPFVVWETLLVLG